MTEAAAVDPPAAPESLALACSSGGIVEQYSRGLFGLGDLDGVELEPAPPAAPDACS